MTSLTCATTEHGLPDSFLAGAPPTPARAGRSPGTVQPSAPHPAIQRNAWSLRRLGERTERKGERPRAGGTPGQLCGCGAPAALSTMCQMAARRVHTWGRRKGRAPSCPEGPCQLGQRPPTGHASAAARAISSQHAPLPEHHGCRRCTLQRGGWGSKLSTAFGLASSGRPVSHTCSLGPRCACRPRGSALFQNKGKTHRRVDTALRTPAARTLDGAWSQLFHSGTTAVILRCPDLRPGPQG